MTCEPLYAWAGPDPIWPCHLQPCTWEGQLTSAQQQGASCVADAITQGRSELLVWAVCGAGKTEMLFQGITEALKQGKRICIATPRADVVRELKPRMQRAFKGVSIQALFGGSAERDGTAQLIIATTHQLLRFQKAFDVMIIDEVDAFPFHADPSLPFATYRAKKTLGTTIYLTATPRKQQRNRIKRQKLPHVFIPNRYHGHPLPVPQMRMTRTLAKALRAYYLPDSCITWLKKRQNPQRQLLIFIPEIALAKQLLTPLAKTLITERVIEDVDSVSYVHAHDPERLEKVKQFRQKELSVLLTTTILERGVTFPSVDVIVLNAGHDIFDEAALVQISGRAGRSADDPTGEVVFFHDGKTEAMMQAIKQIKMMNERGGF
ncbi:DEAD/DEAH box helicase [Lentibacillus saliphilus]|uniref:DEAD/DEAH box helicase n=1 Tax=Lentibacillus saliphilus TaxID=2737028 RepID=UPI001FEBD211|nr:DEAD/DEAH box helicase family protein [Lentibacillus saliphilus]